MLNPSKLLDIGKIMQDKEWLEKVRIAYKEYPYPSLQVEQFLIWLYKQYGIVLPEVKK